MSGESSGLLLLSLALLDPPVLGIALAGYAVVAGLGAASNAASNYEKNRRKRRENEIKEIRQSSGKGSIGDFRRSVATDMKEQSRQSVELSNQMMGQMAQSRSQLQQILNENDREKYQQYIAQLDTKRRELSHRMLEMQDDFTRRYEVKINENMARVSNTINSQYNKTLSEIESIKADQRAKNDKARAVADDYLEEAKTLITALEVDYEAGKFLNSELINLQNTLATAQVQYNNGHYEAAIATAKNLAVEAIEEIYKADAKRQEWDNLYKCAVTLAAELGAGIKAQEIVTEEVKKQLEEKTGKPIEADVVGIKVSEYTGKMENGQSQFDYYLEKTEKIKQTLESQDGDNLTTAQLREYIKILNDDIYPGVNQSIYRGILNMSNAFSRQNISEEIIEFFEDHNFTFSGYNYENDAHDGALHVGFENDTTGEEIIVTLAPEYMSNGDVQTKVDIDQIKGDGTNEERKAYFRTSVENVVVDSTPGAQIKLECHHNTRNKLSGNTKLWDKLKV